MNAMSPVIMLELNELCPPIVDRMLSQGRLPNFAALKARSRVHVTTTTEDPLEPWVQWVTLHTGVRQEVHGALELDEGHKIGTERIWDTLAKDGVRSLVFCSMNGDTRRPDKVTLVPDPWSSGVKATDASFQPFHDFISHHVTEHTNPETRPGLTDTAKVAGFLLSHGLKLETISKAIAQIASEKTASRDLYWRRAIFLDNLLWDVFEAAWKRQKPEFATFFANSTAFLQHRYWRHMEPDVYQVKPSEADMKSYGSAIEDSYIHMDEIVGRALRLAGPNGRIIFATALSQEANLRYEHIGGKFVYRPRNFEGLFAWAGAPKPVGIEPVMTHEAWATFASEADALAAEQALENIQSNGRSVMRHRRDGARVFFNCDLISVVEDGFTVARADTGDSILFDKLFHLIGQVNNSQHNRNGCFWVPAGPEGPQVVEGLLPLEEAHEHLLDVFRVKAEQLVSAA